MPSLSLPEFADKITEIMPVVLKEFSRRQVDELYKGKITLQQFLVLDFLHKAGESNMTSLAHFMDVTTPAMTGIVDRLVRDGYVVRVYDEKDRRIIMVRLTAKGSELLRKICDHRRQMITRVFGEISESDRRDYLRVITQIKENLIK